MEIKLQPSFLSEFGGLMNCRDEVLFSLRCAHFYNRHHDKHKRIVAFRIFSQFPAGRRSAAARRLRNGHLFWMGQRGWWRRAQNGDEHRLESVLSQQGEVDGKRAAESVIESNK